MNTPGKKIKFVDNGPICLIDRPCIHRVTIIYEDDSKEIRGGIKATEIAGLYGPYLSPEDKKHVEYVTNKKSRHYKAYLFYKKMNTSQRSIFQSPTPQRESEIKKETLENNRLDSPACCIIQ
jgi:hypothetical protein